MLRIVEGRADRFILESADINRLGTPPLPGWACHPEDCSRPNARPMTAACGIGYQAVAFWRRP